MRTADTNLGGANRGFPETTAGLTEPLAEPRSPEYQASLATLCRRYWKPVYGYIRVAWAKSNEDAKDLTQAFFLWLLEGSALVNFDPQRGSFRGYLKVLLRRFVGHQEAALHRLKRGGDIQILPLGDAGATLESVLGDPGTGDPEQAFERVWVIELLNETMERIRERSRGGPRSIPFQIYESYDLVPMSERPTYKELACRWNLSEKDIKNHLYGMREEVRKEIRAELAGGTGDERHLNGDWDALLGSQG
jgi:RNA polymerase sigma factor (sigma-70 family)